MRNPHAAWLAATLTMLCSAQALAQTPSAETTHTYPPCSAKPTDVEVNAAKGAFQAGQGSFNEADYGRAITYWEDAYRRDCTAHALLLNLARAYELNAQKSQAVVALETYLQRKPGTAQREQIQRRIDVLKTQIAESEKAKAAPAAAPEAAPAESQVSLSTLESGPARPDRDARRRSIAPLIVAGAGGAIAIVGGVLYLGARSDLSDAKEACPDLRCSSKKLEDEGDSANTRVNVTGAVAVGGLAIAAGGLVWYFVQKPTERSAERQAAASARRNRSARVEPAVGPGFAGLSFAGRF